MLQHTPGRACFVDQEELGNRLPDVESEIALIEMYGAGVVAVTLNGEGMTHEELVSYRHGLAGRISQPVVLPLEEGVGPVLDALR